MNRTRYHVIRFISDSEGWDTVLTAVSVGIYESLSVAKTIRTKYGGVIVKVVLP